MATTGTVSIPASLIREFLRSPSADIRGRGEIIYLKGNVLEVFYDEKTFTAVAQIQGTRIYSTRIKFSSSFAVILDSSCNCPYNGTCKHIVALAYHLLNTSEVHVASMEGEKRYKLERQKASAFRMIPGKGLRDWQKNLSYFRPHAIFPDRPSNVIKLHFESEGQYKGELYTKDWYSAPEEKSAEVIIRIKDEKLSVKCNSCSLSSENLCKHQYVILDNILNEEDVINLSYDEIIEQNAEKIGVSKDTFLNNFEVVLNNGRFDISSKHQDIVFNEDLESVQNSFNQSFDYDQLALKLETTSLNQEAFLWTDERFNSDADALLILSGKKNKNGTKLVSSFNIGKKPVLLSKAQLDFYNRFQVQQKLFSPEFNETDYTKAWRLTYDHKSVIQSGLNYIYKSLRNQDYYAEGDVFSARKSDLNIFDVLNEELNISVSADKVGEFYQLKFDIYLGDQVYQVRDEDIVAPFFLITGAGGYFYSNPHMYEVLRLIGNKPTKRFIPKNKSTFYELINYLKGKVDFNNDLPLETTDVLVGDYSASINLKEFGDYIVFEPTFKFKEGSLPVLLGDTVFIDGVKYYFPLDAVQNFRTLFLDFNQDFQRESNYPCAYLSKDKYLNQLWYLDFFEKCKGLNIEITGHDAFEKLRLSEFKADIEEQLTSSIDWFDLNIVIKFGDEVIERKQWIKAIKNGNQYIELNDGSLGLLPEEWFERLSSIVRVADDSSTGLRINKMRFNIIDELFELLDDNEIQKEINEKKKALLNYEGRKSYVISESINAEIRPYQQQGYDWLRFLEKYGLGGILADDMGLGKTLQMISLLAHAKSVDNCFALIIVPNSLLFNWSRELDKFCPSLKYMVYHKTNRKEKLNVFEKNDVIITTYGTATKDAQLLNAYTFSHIILDESQAIKNPTSKRFKALRLLKGRYKFCLTGTPIENNTFDLYAQMSFVNPGLLGNQTYFKTYFSNPIDKAGDAEATKLLTKMVHPFLLRRTKDQVAKDLPDKTESVIYCEMYPHQRQMYNELKEQIRRDLVNRIADDDSNLKFMVLDGLLRLRQLCNSPLLVDGGLNSEEARSAKIDALIYSLSEEIGEGNALVFSQFVQTLSLIKRALDLKGIKYAYLDGQTKKRDEVVDRFMNDEDCKVFLLSLKAGNTGLNLTKAQYVYIFDPWWNPAVEAQAIDRTHRIGQDNKVFAYKLICKDTVEEKIVQLQKRKKKIASDIIKTDEAVFKSLKKEDILALFE